ncbi:probable protein S-acyltransferase 16 isoform X2 [Selaginella moellendorffii]|uniref:probable protein S-acyltransferase 16 isoform X2 n=1 Tax=Selaginella moellendorffii TaxID=88036 RepID=UPI000D1C2CFF|nr:probable protein S-acyltransferase 16 isoform X2 [Selaginella moellendorffii]XP_024537065.1 probable protein S-acyltransferase 16 isoform X2 [Selaginella moellendorffii]|eukprot:XP_024516801.1 probable protein S-acyltransferase 16 isoform X2 [Selaginella moellendorffii]
MGYRSCLSLPVAVVLMLVGFVYYTVVFLVLDPWLDLATANGLANALAFTATTLMALVSYALAILRDPGEIPSSYLPDVEDSQQAPLQEVKRKGGDLRYCQKCRVYKPPRAHHCRVCKRCVLRMDHHCLWINNCVGHNNYKSFFLFVLYITSACIYSLVVLGFHAVDEFERALEVVAVEDDAAIVQPVKASVATASLLKIICGIVVIPLSVALSGLLVWHIYLSLHNRTTIEYYEGVRAKWLAHTSGPYSHPYDLGALSNILVVLGPKASCWFCPMAVGHIGSGLHFKTSGNAAGKL